MREKELGPLVFAGVLLGIGLAGLFDSILLQQILQLHGMISSKVPLESIRNARENLLWSGIFNGFYWLSLFTGIVFLYQTGKRKDALFSGQGLAGAILAGWGGFMLAEGLLAHHVFRTHHVLQSANPAAQETGDYAYLVIGALIGVLGVWAIGSVRSAEEEKVREQQKQAFRSKSDENDRVVYLD
jgi:uncharacterized membrane protein